jgi:[ribosomal protein S18]-alanine N-acetyltransferase
MARAQFPIAPDSQAAEPAALQLVAADAQRLDAMMQVMRGGFDPGFGEAWSASQLVGTLAELNSFARLALAADGSPAGFSLCRCNGPEVELLLIAVLPDRRGRGFGEALLAQACGEARDLRASEIFLEVRENNLAARRLYGRAGFAEVGRRRDYYTGAGGVRYAALTMRRLLIV